MKRAAAAIVGLIVWASGIGVAAADPEGLVWRVEGRDNTVYLAGSMHLLPERAYPLPPAYERAYDDSDMLVVEADPRALQTNDARRTMRSGARYAGADTLSAHLDAGLYARTSELLEAHGLAMNVMNEYRPWFVAISVETEAYRQADFRPDLGLDQHFDARAVADGKPILPLQDVASHLAIFTAMPETLSHDQLAVTVAHADELAGAPGAVYEFWRSGNAAGLAASVAEQANAYPALFDRLIYDRNDAWLEPIGVLLQSPGNAMVLVGAAHLVGADGLVAQLKRRGLHVTRMD